MKEVTIHTDGACEGNPGPGGWAAVLRHGTRSREISGGDPATTNNRMELQAAIAALQALKEPCQVELWTDSEYLRQGITEWLPGWKRRGWRTMDKKPVKNADLWRTLETATARHQIRWQWLKGHAGHADNERCDVLARAETEKVRKLHPPEQLATLRAAFAASRKPDANQGSLLQLDDVSNPRSTFESGRTSRPRTAPRVTMRGTTSTAAAPRGVSKSAVSRLRK